MKLTRIYFILMLCSLMAFHPAESFCQLVSVSGVVTSCSGQLPVTGALLKFLPAGGGSAFTAMSTTGGAYSLNIPSGTYSKVQVIKTGFDTAVSTSVVIPAGPSFTLSFCVYELSNPVPSVSALFDTASASVHCSWTFPVGPYELLYDDGIQDNFTVWASAGSKNALKFTPLAWPVKIRGGRLNIGTQSNYPAQYNHAAFQVAVYDATGPSGEPGNQLAMVTVNPSAWEWTDFQFASPVSISSGNFYLVMIQLGNYPDATGLAIDLTDPQFRSWAKSGSQPWVPAQGNFMIRATVEGPGGPALLDNQAAVQNYQLFRLRQGEEQNPSVWTPVAVTPALSYTDNSWPSLPCGPYRWAVKALYPLARQSVPCFSNAIGKCWTAPVVVNVALSCPDHTIHGTRVSLVNQVYPDTVYFSILDTNHRVVFPHVWKGTYNASVTHFGFTAYSSQLSLMIPDTISTTLQQVKSPPTDLAVDGKTLRAGWKMPAYRDTLFSENWSSGSFSTHGWSTDPIYTNWKISYANGNPPPSAYFDWTPQLVDYDQSLQTPMISNPGAAVTTLGYDIFLDNYAMTTQNRLAVEIWNGSSWNTVKVYSNQDGDIQWTSEQLDISSGLSPDFKIRFRAFGGNSFDINGWNLDNIYVLASEAPQQMGQCIMGYYFLLGNVISGYAPANEYTIPGAQVQYGQTYNACVEAIYGSGISSQSCTTFQSTFLEPVINFGGDTIQNAVYLHWQKPSIGTGPPPGLLGYSIYRDSSLIAFVTADTLYYYDLSLAPGTYSYQISARYDLSPYGYPGMSDESYRQGPVELYISYGRLIPFFEPWTMGSFSYNSWTFNPAQGNWDIDGSGGLPPPSAVFNWDPPETDYSFALESGDLDPAAYHCAGIWLDFQLRLEDLIANSEEKISVEVYYNNAWHTKQLIVNNGSFDWTYYHINISEVRQKGFRIRFLASGVATANILHWMLDNISVYGICYAPVNLTADAAGYDVNLSWSRPLCTNGGMILDEGFEGEIFPPPSWTQIIHDGNGTWKQGNRSTPQGVHSGQYAALLAWDYAHQDEWLIAHDAYVSGNLTFWSYAYQGSTHGDHYYVLISQDQGQNWTSLLDLSALPVYPQNNGFNSWQQPYVIDMAAYKGSNVDLAWRAVDGDGLGLWYTWAVDDVSLGYTPLNLSGYDVYRKHPDSAVYSRINRNAVQDTVYTDSSLAPGPYKYYVVALLGECTQGTPSDTVLVDVVTGTGRVSEEGVKVFPNPAKDVIRILSSTDIERAWIFDQVGMLVKTPAKDEISSGTLSLRGLAVGVYCLKLQMRNEVKTVLIIKSQ